MNALLVRVLLLLVVFRFVPCLNEAHENTTHSSHRVGMSRMDCLLRVERILSGVKPDWRERQSQRT